MPNTVRWIGNVGKYNSELKAGHILTRNGSKNVSFEGDGFKEGDEIEYEVMPNPRGGVVAINVKKTEDVKSQAKVKKADKEDKKD